MLFYKQVADPRVAIACAGSAEDSCESPIVAIGAVLFGSTLVPVCGPASGYFGGFSDMLRQRIIESLQLLAALILAMSSLISDFAVR
jgi:ABC-type microcin C transport system permease subunit YejE